MMNDAESDQLHFPTRCDEGSIDGSPAGVFDLLAAF